MGAGIWLAEIPEISRRIVPFSGGVLTGIAFFWILPEIALNSGWPGALMGMAGGFGLLWAIDHFLYPVCPACSHTHDHGACAKSLHGFAAPLLAAASVHSFFDGWSVAVSVNQSSESLRTALLIGIGVHKLPEGLALGVLLLAATGSIWKAALSAVAVQSTMVLGALTAVFVASHLAAHGTSALLSVASGVFAYLGYHAIKGEPADHRGLATYVPALTGAAGAAVLRLLPSL